MEIIDINLKAFKIEIIKIRYMFPTYIITFLQSVFAEILFS